VFDYSGYKHSRNLENICDIPVIVFCCGVLSIGLCIYTHIFVYVCVVMCEFVCGCVSVWVFMFVCVCVSAYSYMYALVHVCTYVMR